MKIRRFGLLDTIRGAVLISMIAYHACWDLVYLFGKNWSWYFGSGAYLWQQSICWSFILLSGYCWSLGRRPFQRGLTVFGTGALVTVVTLLFMPDNAVLFGVLTLIGSCMLLLIPLEKGLRDLRAGVGVAVSIGLFILTKEVNNGFLGFGRLRLAPLPEKLYAGWLSTYLGFPMRSFYSTDYFSLLPWLFLFLSGYFIYRMISEKGMSEKTEQCLCREWKPLSFLGRHSLILYMLHQPVIYGVLLLLQESGVL